MSHPIVHIEFAAGDPKAAGKFYGDIFGWEIEIDENLNYTMFTAEGGPGGGFNSTSQEGVSAGDVLVYIATDDIDDTLARVEANGGKPLVPKTEIPNVGWFGIFADPTGNRVGLFTGMGGE